MRSGIHVAVVTGDSYERSSRDQSWETHVCQPAQDHCIYDLNQLLDSGAVDFLGIPQPILVLIGVLIGCASNIFCGIALVCESSHGDLIAASGLQYVALRIHVFWEHGRSRCTWLLEVKHAMLMVTLS